MRTLIGVLDAATVARSTKEQIITAMFSGELAWKSSRGHIMTSVEWIKRWQSQRNCKRTR